MIRKVIGTAGHVDHGKSTLIKALTGTDPDRLKAEKARGLTIELGFAHLDLPQGTKVSIIDVPGHQQFLKNMLAGVYGIELALLLVAANEGVMPQTREHFNIINLLKTPKLIAVISKIDLVQQEVINGIAEQIKELLKDTPYAEAPVVRVSARTNQGLDNLLAILEKETAELPARQVRQDIVRLPVDRVFLKQGVGVVVTGTLRDGVVHRNDLLEIPGSTGFCKVREIQIHGQRVLKAVAGQRLALNLAGLEIQNIRRGDVLATPGRLKPHNRLDLALTVVTDFSYDLLNQQAIRFHQGTQETFGRIIILGANQISPGEDGFVQVILDESVSALRGDRFILRSYAPPQLIGGGVIVEPQAPKHRKKDSCLQEELVFKASGDILRLISYYLAKQDGFISLSELATTVALDEQEIEKYLPTLIEEGLILEVPQDRAKTLYLSTATLLGWENVITREIILYLTAKPLSQGLLKEEARQRIGRPLSVRDFNMLLQIMQQRKTIELVEQQYLLPYNYDWPIPSGLTAKLHMILASYQTAGWRIPEWRALWESLDLKEQEARQIIQYHLRKGNIVKLRDALFLPTTKLREGKYLLQEWFQKKNTITPAELRDLLGTTRRVIIPLLEYYDQKKVTVKNGNLHLAGPLLFDKD